MAEYLQTTDQAVIDCMGSVPECAANGCQFRKTDGYRKGEGPVTRLDDPPLTLVEIGGILEMLVGAIKEAIISEQADNV